VQLTLQGTRGEGIVRISDERYRRDLRRLRLAWRMVLLGARTPTIMRWTSLSKYNIRKLRNDYAEDSAPREGLKGKTPFRVEFFCKSAALRGETPMLAGFLRHFDVLPAEGEARVNELPDLSRGERLCSAYEQFRLACPHTEITFERAVTLLIELARGELIRLANCSTCGELVVHDCLSARRPLCAYCFHEAHAGQPYFQVREPTLAPQAHSEMERADAHQQSLF
jgi:hypothetical protein